VSASKNSTEIAARAILATKSALFTFVKHNNRQYVFSLIVMLTRKYMSRDYHCAIVQNQAQTSFVAHPISAYSIKEFLLDEISKGENFEKARLRERSYRFAEIERTVSGWQIPWQLASYSCKIGTDGRNEGSLAASSRFREVIEEGVTATVTSKKTLKGFFSINGSLDPHGGAESAR